MPLPLLRTVTESRTTTNTASFTVTMPTDRPDGRFFFLHIVADGASPVSDPSGWTRINRATQGTTNAVSTWVGYRVGSSEPASYSAVTDGATSEGWSASVMGFDRVDPFTSIDTFSVNSAASSTAASSGITTTVPDTMVIWAMGNDTVGVISTTSASYPAAPYFGLTQVTPTTDASQAIALHEVPASGSVAGVSGGAFIGSDDWIVHAVAIAGDPFVSEITSVTGANAAWLQDGETGVVFAGVNFLSVQGIGTLELWDTLAGATQIAQTVTSWSDTSITATIGRSTLSAGRLYAVVTTSAGIVSEPIRVVVLPSAPDVKIAEARASANTSTGNQDITSADISGITPKAVMFRMVRATADGSTPHLGICVGFATSSSARTVVSIKSEDGAGTTNLGRKISNVLCLSLIDPASTSAAIEGEADFVSFISGGCRVNWSTAPPSGYQIIATFFCGTYVQGHVSTSAPSLSWTPATNKIYQQVTTGIGDPDFVATLVSSTSAYGAASASSGMLCFGMFSANGFGLETVHPQSGMRFSMTDNVTTEASDLNIHSDAAVPSGVSSGRVQIRRDYRDRDVGFTFVIRDSSFGQLAVPTLELVLPGVRSWVGPIDPRTSTGSQSITTPGWLPQWAGNAQTMSTAYSTSQSNDNANAFSLSSVAGTTSQVTGVGVDDGLTSGSNNISFIDDKLIYLEDTAVGALFDGSFTSFDSTGWTQNFTTTQGTQRKWFGFAIEGQSAGTPTGVLVGTLGLTGAIEAQHGVSGTLGGTLALSGSFAANHIAPVVGTITGVLGLTGAFAAAHGVRGPLAGSLALSGAFAGQVVGAVTGTMAGVLGLSGLIRAKHPKTKVAGRPKPTRQQLENEVREWYQEPDPLELEVIPQPTVEVIDLEEPGPAPVPPVLGLISGRLFLSGSVVVAQVNPYDYARQRAEDILLLLGEL